MFYIFFLLDIRKPHLKQEDPYLSTMSKMREEKTSAIQKLSGPDMYIKTSAHDEAFKYMCGAAINIYLQQCGGCYDCESLLCAEAPIHSFVEMRKYDAASDLKYPSSQCVKHLKVVDNILYRHLPHKIHTNNLLNTLFHIVQQEVSSKLPSCKVHEIICDNVIVKKWIQMSIKIYCKDFLRNKMNKRRLANKRRKMFQSNIPAKRERLF